MNTGLDWVPDACTLPTAERPLRIAEFTDLFATALRGVARPSRTRLRLTLDASARQWAVRLAEAEAACCGFFDFTVGEAVEGRVTVDVVVPAARVAVLDGLAAQAGEARS